ncbi:hypothetical protein GCM10022229_23920 [Luteimonas lutimaris]|uniref:OmpR/PhoB-type domain-containing protein n=1 Tax=Luteimonas lutimaris TaxID=698645 RepID=A0ABP7MSQ4_9GAMM
MKLAAADRDDGTAGQYRFGDVVVDASAHTLVRGGAPQPLEPKAFAVLLALLRRPGELIGRDDLLDRVWGHRHVTPGVLTRAIAQLRHALDDDSHNPRYIQTRHALGYCFIGVLEDGEAAGAPEQAAGVPDTASGLSSEMETGLAIPESDAGPLLPEGGAAAGGAPEAAAGTLAAQTPASPRRLPRRWPWLAAAAAIVLVLAAAWWLHDRATAVPRPAEASVAILPFTTLSDDRDDRYFAEGLALEMHEALAGVPGIKVAARTSPDTIAGDGAFDAKALGARLGVATLLDASIRREGSRVRVNARLTDTGSGYTLWTHSYDRQLSDVFDVQNEIADEVVHALLGVIPAQEGAIARRLAPTRSLAAYDAYLRGLDRLQARGEDGNLASAVGYFNQALSADSGFARAQAGICRAEIRHFEYARDADAYTRARDACERAAGMDPGLHELRLAFGDLYRVRGESAKAIEQYTGAMEDPAFAADADIGIARVHGANGRAGMALEYLRRALDLRPGDGETWREIGYQQYASGNLDGAIEAYRKATELQPREVRPGAGWAACTWPRAAGARPARLSGARCGSRRATACWATWAPSSTRPATTSRPRACTGRRPNSSPRTTATGATSVTRWRRRTVAATRRGRCTGARSSWRSLTSTSAPTTRRRWRHRRGTGPTWARPMPRANCWPAPRRWAPSAARCRCGPRRPWPGWATRSRRVPGSRPRAGRVSTPTVSARRPSSGPWQARRWPARRPVRVGTSTRSQPVPVHRIPRRSPCVRFRCCSRFPPACPLPPAPPACAAPGNRDSPSTST